MISVASLRSIYQGRPAAVLGGGPSLRADLQLLSSGTVGFSVNQHALRFCEPAFLVFMDKLSDVPELAAAVASFKGLKVSQITGQGDIDLSGVPYWDGGFSSSLATWLACYLDCDPVLLCGMDCYQGEKKYCYDHDLDHPTVNYPIENHLKAWRPALVKCPHPERIKAVSGPLVEIFGKYKR